MYHTLIGGSTSRSSIPTRSYNSTVGNTAMYWGGYCDLLSLLRGVFSREEVGLGIVHSWTY